jgi:hypothetical protein
VEAAVLSHTTIDAFTGSRGPHTPRMTVPLVLASVTVATLAMWVDDVSRYSATAVHVGVGLAFGFGVVLDEVLCVLARRPGRRLLATILAPVTFGVVIGMAIQSVVLGEAGPIVKDLGGRVSTDAPGPWIASGALLGGLPAFLVAGFVLIAARSLRRVRGLDASDDFGVTFLGACGVVAGLGLDFVDFQGAFEPYEPYERADSVAGAALPLLGVTLVSFVMLLRALLADSARIRLVRRLYAGQISDVEVAPADRFADDPSLRRMVSDAREGAVVVRLHHNASYREGAAEALALVSETLEETLRPLIHRRLLSLVGLFLMGTFLAFVATHHALLVF